MKLSAYSDNAQTVPKLHDRNTGGHLLAEQLKSWTGSDDAIVLGIPRGGIPVAAAIAEVLQLPLDVMVVQRIRLPQHDAWQQAPNSGAMARGGSQFLYSDLITEQHPLSEDMELAMKTAKSELERKEFAFRNQCPQPDLAGKAVILVDDGIVTGMTMRAAIAAAHNGNPSKVIIAVPFATITALQNLNSLVDESVCLWGLPMSAPIHSLYEEPRDFSEEDVRVLIEAGQRRLSLGRKSGPRHHSRAVSE